MYGLVSREEGKTREGQRVRLGPDHIGLYVGHGFYFLCKRSN